MSAGDGVLAGVGFWVFGCRLNQAEAAAWQAALAARGVAIVPRESAAVVCVHSCAVTAPALHEVVKAVRAFRRRRPDVRIVLSGCAAELVPAGLAELVLPHREKANWVARVMAYLAELPSETFGAVTVRGRTRASLIVQDGCDRFCAYCIVPYLRGAPVSVPMAQLLREAAELFARGYREIVLTGCHLALYRDPATGAGFESLLAHLCDVPGAGRFRIGSIEPGVLDDVRLIRQIAGSGGRVCAFLHWPIQSAADGVLARMGRPYRVADLQRLMAAVAEWLPFCGLGADWIAGLPGETAAEAAETQRFVAAHPFTGAHIFPYSRRPGTRAAAFSDQCPEAVIRARAAALGAVAAERRAETLQRFVGRTLEVIPERQVAGLWEGWSAERLRCRLPFPAVRGQPVSFCPTGVAGEKLV